MLVSAIQSIRGLLAAASLLAAISSKVAAEVIPDLGESPPVEASVQEDRGGLSELTVPPPSPSPPDSPTGAPPRIFVSKIQVTGSTVLTPDDLNSIVQPFEGRDLTLEELRQVADAITELYLQRGYITSKARPVSQTIEGGVVEIQVTEGRLEEIQIEGTQRLDPSYVRNRIALGAGVPLNISQLEDQLRLLRANPLFKNLEASLRPSGELGKSLLIVRVQEADPFSISLGIDNYSPAQLGSYEGGISNLRYLNLTGIGDALSGYYYYSTTGGNEVFELRYQVPLNPMDGSLQLKVSPYWQKITESPAQVLGIRGQRWLYDITYRQPLLRTPREELALSLGFLFQDGQTFLFDDIPFPFGIGPQENGSTRISLFHFDQDYVIRELDGSWAVRSQFRIGTCLFGATCNPSPIPSSQFFSWLGQVQRVQFLNEDHLLVVQANLQLTPDSLFPAQQFVIGGIETVRGYRQNARSGDSGFSLSVEDRIAIERDEAGTPVIQIAPFVDLGAVWNAPNNPNTFPTQKFLVSAGLGFLWNQFLGLDGVNLRLDYGIPIIYLKDRGDTLQDNGFYFSIQYQP